MTKSQIYNIFYASLPVIFIIGIILNLSLERELPEAAFQPAEYPPEITEIDELIATEDYIDAKNRSLALIEENPELAIAYHQLARIEFSLGNVMQAIEHTQIARALHPEEGGYLRYLIDLYRTIGHFPTAYETINDVLAVNPNHIDALIERAETSFMIGRHEEGLQDISRAVDVSDGNPDIRLRRAHFYANSGQFELAIEDLQILVNHEDERIVTVAQDLLTQIENIQN